MSIRYRVYILNTESVTSNRYITLSVMRAFSASSEVELVKIGEYSNAVGEFLDGKYDVLLCIGGAADNAPILSRLCKLAKISVLWITEDPYELRRNVAYSDIFDIIFTNDKMSVHEYSGRASHLPLAADATFNYIPALTRDEDYLYDLLFIGTAWPNRVSLINELLTGLGPALKAKIALSYNQFLPVPKLVNRELITDWRCSNIEFSKLANKSRVVLSIDRIFSASPGSPLTGSTPPPRLFESALAGGFQVYVSESDEAKGYFDDGNEFIHCNYESALECVRTALLNSRTRMEGAAAAQQRAQRDHLYANRVAVIVAALQKNQSFKPAAITAHVPLKTIMVVTHNVSGSRPGGGVEIYQEQLKNLPVNYRLIYLHPIDSRTFRITCYSETRDYEIHLPHGQYDLSNRSLENLFQKLIFEWKVDLVHFQHLLGFCLSLPLVARSCGVPTVWTYHDHYLICERFTLLDHEGRFCDTASKTLVTCDVCLAASGGLPAGSQARRRNFITEVTSSLSAIVTSTDFSKSYLLSVYPNIPVEAVSVLEMLTPNTSSFEAENAIVSPRSGRLKVAIPGNFNDVKGAAYILRIFNIMRDDEIEFSVLGRLDKPFDEILETLNLKNVRILGGYNQAEIALILSEFNMSLHLSLWPETFMISLSESWLAGVVPIVTGLGAQGERVTDQIDGFIVEPHDPAAVVTILRGVIAGTTKLAPVVNRIRAKRVMTAGQHVSNLEILYKKLIAERPLLHEKNLLRYRTYYGLDLFDSGIRTNSRVWSSSDIDWDETFLSVTELTADPPVFDFPGEFSHLTLAKLKAGDDEVKIEFEAIRCDGRKAEKTTNSLASRSLELKGWVTIACDIQFVKRFLVLKGATITLYVPSPVVSRPDVAEAFGNLDSSESGFDVNVDVSHLPSGAYEISILNIFNGKVYDISSLRSVFVEHQNHEDGTLVWMLGDGFAGDVPSNALPFSDVELSFEDHVNDATLTRFPVLQNRLRFAGTAQLENFQTFVTHASIVLASRASSSVFWTRAVRFAAMRASREKGNGQIFEFHVDLTLDVIPMDLYDVSVVVHLRDSIFRSPSLAVVDTRYGLQHKVILRSQFDEQIAGAELISEDSLEFVIDSVATVQGSSYEQSGMLDVTGWAFRKGLGSPLAAFSYYEDDGLNVLVPGVVVTRSDVADYLNDCAAAQSGFRLTIPSDSVPGRSLKFCQVYEHGTITFANLEPSIDAYRIRMLPHSEMDSST